MDSTMLQQNKQQLPDRWGNAQINITHFHDIILNIDSILIFRIILLGYVPEKVISAVFSHLCTYEIRNRSIDGGK